MREIATQFYSSTLSFVSVNELEQEAIELWGIGWESEDDCDQIEELLLHIGRGDLMVLHHEELDSEEDIEVCERFFKLTIDDLKDLKYLITQKLVEEGLIKDCTDTDEEDEVNCENVIQESFKEFLKFDYE